MERLRESRYQRKPDQGDSLSSVRLLSRLLKSDLISRSIQVKPDWNTGQPQVFPFINAGSTPFLI